MSRNRKRKSNHSHSKKSMLTEIDKTQKKQNDEYKSLNQYSEENDDEVLRKHKCSKHNNLNIMESIILLLVLKKNGILDELIDYVENKEFEMGS